MGARDFDAKVELTSRGPDDFVEELAANHAMAAMMARSATRFRVSGTWQGQAVEVGTAVVPGRDFDVVISYVCALDDSLHGMFRAMTKGATTTFSRLGMHVNPQTTGDASFDDAWIVDGDATLVARLLDDATRATLMELRARLSWMQVASVEVTRVGMMVRWPGPASAKDAAALRDLMIDLRARLRA